MRKRYGSILLACVMIAGLGTLGPDVRADATSGQFLSPFSENGDFDQQAPDTIEESLKYPPAVTVVVLPDGRILYWGGLEGLEDSAAPIALDAGRSHRLSRSRVLDLSGEEPAWLTPATETGGGHDMFCADQRLLADGRVMVAGGTIWTSDPIDLSPITGDEGPGGTAELFGSNHARTFDPTTNDWTLHDNTMNYGRWYPTLVTLPDGDLFVASGVARLLYNTEGTNVHQTETYDVQTDTWTDNGESAATSLPLFSRMHLLPDGKVFYTGAGQMWGPFGQSYDQALWNIQRIYDPATKTWSDAGMGSFGARSGAFSVMLPLRPGADGEYANKAEILVGGGTLGTSPGAYFANNLTEIVTVENGEATSKRGPDLNNNRWYSSGVLLPDGSVVAVSGADKDEVIAPGTEAAVRQAELFDPAANDGAGAWLPLASGSRDRTYHNAAVLLQDGSVLVTGHSPINTLYGPTADNSMTPLGTANNFKDPSFEILKPPYLYRGARPTLMTAPEEMIYDSQVALTVAPADAGTIDQVVLVRLPSTTHTTDADMRAVEVPFTQNGTSLNIETPPDGKVAPPGYYYVFALRDNGQGLTPSEAKIVRLS